MSISRFETMLKTNNVYFFDANEFEEITQHYLDIGKHSLAHKSLQLAFDQHPTSVDLKLLKVELFVFEDKIKEAIELLSEVEGLDPTNDEVFIQKAVILSKTNKHKEAIAVLNASLEFVEDAFDVCSLIGMEYLYLNDYENARLNFEKCVAIDIEDFSSLYNIIYCFEMLEQYNEAIQYLTLYINKNPYSEVAWHQLGSQYVTLNNYEEALKAFDYAVIIDDSFIGGYLEKAKVLEELKRYKEAIENYIITLELDDPTAYAYLRIGVCFEQLDNLDGAVQYYKKAVNEDPLLDRGWILLTDLYCKAEKYPKAIYYINKAIKIDESNTMYWRKYADINVSLNFYDEAVKAFQKCIELNDLAIEVYIALADVLMFLGEFEEALAVLISAKNTHTAFAEIEYRLCGLFMILDEREFALTHLKNGLAIDDSCYLEVKKLYPTVFEDDAVKTTIANYQKTLGDIG